MVFICWTAWITKHDDAPVHKAAPQRNAFPSCGSGRTWQTCSPDLNPFRMLQCSGLYMSLSVFRSPLTLPSCLDHFLGISVCLSSSLCALKHCVCLSCVFQTTVNKLVSVVLSVTKDIPLWTYSHLQYKQQEVLWSVISFTLFQTHLLPDSQSHSSIIFLLSASPRWSRQRFGMQETTSRWSLRCWGLWTDSWLNTKTSPSQSNNAVRDVFK